LLVTKFPKGELFHHIKSKNKFSEQTVVYYSSQVVLALEYLHETLNMIYRDLKPENILMDEEGNIKLSDFGLAKSSNKEMSCLWGNSNQIKPI